MRNGRVENMTFFWITSHVAFLYFRRWWQTNISLSIYLFQH